MSCILSIPSNRFVPTDRVNLFRYISNSLYVYDGVCTVDTLCRYRHIHYVYDYRLMRGVIMGVNLRIVNKKDKAEVKEKRALAKKLKAITSAVLGTVSKGNGYAWNHRALSIRKDGDVIGFVRTSEISTPENATIQEVDTFLASEGLAMSVAGCINRAIASAIRSAAARTGENAVVTFEDVNTFEEMDVKVISFEDLKVQVENKLNRFETYKAQYGKAEWFPEFLGDYALAMTRGDSQESIKTLMASYAARNASTVVNA